MRNHSALLIDDYYDDPVEIRELALKLDFRPKDGAQYPGGEAYSSERDWEIVRQDIIKLLDMGTYEKSIPGKKFKQGKFRLALKADETARPDGVHQDQQRYSAIIYLSRNEDCKGGIGLYRCRFSGETSITKKWLCVFTKRFNVQFNDPHFLSLMRSYYKDWSNWDKIGELPMRFNRMIVLMAQCFHAPTGIFGAEATTGRLTQHFEIYL